MKRFRKVLFLLFLVFTPAISMADDNSWLVGVWELDATEKEEFLEFTAENTVSLVSGRGRKIDGDYRLADSVIKIVYNFKGKKIPIDLNYSSAKNVLSGNMSNTGNQVKYTKKQ